MDDGEDIFRIYDTAEALLYRVTADLRESGLKVLSVYGSEDGVLHREKYRGYSAMLPEDTVETVISGGNHSGFGSYGTQEGDGAAAISQQEQV